MGWVVNATPRPLYPRERPITHCIGGWVGLRAGLAGAEKLSPTGIRSPDRPARSESVYQCIYICICIYIYIYIYMFLFLFNNVIYVFLLL